jgi:hypothetical protein
VLTMRRRLAWLAILSAMMLGATGAAVPSAAAVTPTPISVYGTWHCSDDFCTWGTARPVAEFASRNGWLIDRGDGRPSVNLVVLSFVNPLKLLDRTTDATTLDGVPRGMTQEIVTWFKQKNIRVMLSIGGITYTKDWNTALAKNATLLGQRAAEVAGRLGVGIEVDYEQSKSPDLVHLQQFIDAYRAVHPYDATGGNHAARLTIDLAAGDRWLIELTKKATADWLRPDGNVLDYANAMVPARQPSTSAAIGSWQEHIDGKPQYAPPIPPLSPARFTGGIYLAGDGKVRPECNNFGASLQNSTGTFVQSATSVVPNGTPGMLGFMFWASERPSTRGLGTMPPNSCEGGVGVGATTFGITLPMPPLRQH